MADNYLERQYEQYEARKAAWEKARKHQGKKVQKRTQPTVASDTQTPPTETEKQPSAPDRLT